jgi:hypothetical protein
MKYDLALSPYVDLAVLLFIGGLALVVMALVMRLL